jgi:hypothetical protein
MFPKTYVHQHALDGVGLAIQGQVHGGTRHSGEIGEAEFKRPAWRRRRARSHRRW